MEPAARRLRRRGRRRRGRVRASSACRGYDHVPPLALLPLGRVPVLHVRAHAVGRGATRSTSTASSSRRSSRRSSTPARRCRTTTRSAPSTREWLEQDISAPGVGDAARRCSTASTRAATSTRARSSDNAALPRLASADGAPSAREPRTVPRYASSPSRSSYRRRASSATPPSPSRTGRAEPAAERKPAPRGLMSGPPLVPSPLYGLRTWTVVGEPRRASGSPGRSRPCTWPPGGEWLEADVRRTGHTPRRRRGCALRRSTPGIPRRRWARRVLAPRGKIPGVVEATRARSSCTRTASAPSARARTRSSSAAGRNARARAAARAPPTTCQVVEARGPGAVARLVPRARARARRAGRRPS